MYETRSHGSVRGIKRDQINLALPYLMFALHADISSGLVLLQLNKYPVTQSEGKTMRSQVRFRQREGVKEDFQQVSGT